MSGDDHREPLGEATEDAATTPWQQRQELELDLPSATEERANAPRNTGYAVSERKVADGVPAAASPSAQAGFGESAPPGLGPRERLDIPKAPPPRRPGRLAAILVGLALLGAGAAAGVGYWIESERDESGLFSPSDEVLLLVMLRPKGAKLYVDGKAQKSTSLQLPKARGKVVLRAEAPGYRPRQLVVDLATTRVVSLRLRRGGRRAARRSKREAAASSPAAKSARDRPPTPDTPAPNSPAPDPPGPKPQAVDTEKAPIE